VEITFLLIFFIRVAVTAKAEKNPYLDVTTAIRLALQKNQTILKTRKYACLARFSRQAAIKRINSCSLSAVAKHSARTKI